MAEEVQNEVAQDATAAVAAAAARVAPTAQTSSTPAAITKTSRLTVQQSAARLLDLVLLTSPTEMASQPAQKYFFKTLKTFWTIENATRPAPAV